VTETVRGMAAKNAAYVADDALYADDYSFEDDMGSTFLTAGAGAGAAGSDPMPTGGASASALGSSGTNGAMSPGGAEGGGGGGGGPIPDQAYIHLDQNEGLMGGHESHPMDGSIRLAPDVNEVHGEELDGMPSNPRELYHDVNPYNEDVAALNLDINQFRSQMYGDEAGAGTSYFGDHETKGYGGQEGSNWGNGDDSSLSRALMSYDGEDQASPSSGASGRGSSGRIGEYSMPQLRGATGEVSQEDRLSLEQLIGQVEHMMRLYEQNAQYMDAERTRQHLENLRKRRTQFNRKELEAAQQADVQVFFEMVARHQANFDQVWARKLMEHKLRADDLIDQLKWKHDDQQRELYHRLRKKRIPKFSVELLNLRKRQVLLAKAQKYLMAEKIKRKADLLEAIEIDKIRRVAKLDNQLHFEALLKQQQWDRQQLAAKLRLERMALLEAKAQDFQRLKNRLRNSEMELKKSHIRQMLIAERKLHPVYSTVQPKHGKNSLTHQNQGGSSGNLSDSSLRSTGASIALTQHPQSKPSVRELTGQGRASR